MRSGVLLVALMLTMVGTCGLSYGGRDLAPPEDPSDMEAMGDGSPTAAAAEASAMLLMEVLQADPNRRPLGAANMLVSAMLVLGALMLVWRRGSALWWVRQAIYANMVWTALQCGSQVAQLLSESARLSVVFGQEISVRAGELPGDGAAPLGGGHMVWFLVTVFVGVSLVRLLGYGWFLWRIKRPDILSLFQQVDDSI